MVIFIHGLPGSGKSTLGLRLAYDLQWSFLEMDDYISASMKEKMQSGELISDGERPEHFFKEETLNILLQSVEPFALPHTVIDSNADPGAALARMMTALVERP